MSQLEKFIQDKVKEALNPKKEEPKQDDSEESERAE